MDFYRRAMWERSPCLLILTVAYPQLVLHEYSIDSRMSTPTSIRYGSLVARYRYMVLSISSEIGINEDYYRLI